MAKNFSEFSLKIILFYSRSEGVLKEDVEIKLPGKSGIADKVQSRRVRQKGRYIREVDVHALQYTDQLWTSFWYSLYFSTWVWGESEWYCYLLLFNMEIHISKFSKFSQEITQELKICINWIGNLLL